MLYCIVNSKRIIFQLILIISKDVVGFFPSLIVNRIMKQGYATFAKYFMILAHCTSQSLAKTNNVMFCISHQSKNDDVTVSTTQYRLYCVAICLIAIIHSFLSKFVWAPINRTNQTSIDHDDEKMIVLFDIKLTCNSNGCKQHPHAIAHYGPF